MNGSPRCSPGSRVRTQPPCATASSGCSRPACRSTRSGSRRTSSPGVVYAGGTADLSQRTRIDDYAVALDTLAETGLPIHVTELNVVAPDAPELRAAQLEALMRLWWGHPAVEQIVFWGLWNKVNARNYLHHGLWDDDGTLTRQGEAIVSLLNDRWRTRAVVDRRRARHRRAARDARRLRRLVGRERQSRARAVPGRARTGHRDVAAVVR